MLRRRSFWIVLLALALAWFAWDRGNSRADELPATPKPGQYELKTRAGGYDRTALIHIPRGYNADNPAPLVIALHGGGGGGESILIEDGWAKLADEKGFIVVAPTGPPARPRLPGSFLANPQVWNTGQLREGAPRTKIDDVAYLRTLLDELKTKVPYDSSKVFATGHSNGGSMTFRLGAEMADRLAAIGTVAGMVAIDNPQPAKPLPTLFIYGTEDPLLPIDGGESSLPWGTRTTPPVKDLMQKWAKAIQCQTDETIVREDDQTKHVRYASQIGGPELNVLYLKGHGHAWPGADRKLPERLQHLVGPDTSKLDATAELWKFFEASVNQ